MDLVLSPVSTSRGTLLKVCFRDSSNDSLQLNAAHSLRLASEMREIWPLEINLFLICSRVYAGKGRGYQEVAQRIQKQCIHCSRRQRRSDLT